MFGPGTDLFDQGQELSVEVNQRALIDKILARYSGEFTIFRELLQNADDAGAKTVKIRFYTQAGMAANSTQGAELPDIKTVNIHRYVVSNDGIPFRDQDWSRLRKIAEGNPDDDKIGAFGVGYYSVFAITEKPMVTSGDKWMAFYFKDGKDQLYARSGALPADQANDGQTTFTMDLRNPAPLDGPLDLARFLVTSLTFMLKIRRVEMWIDEWNILALNKDVGANMPVETASFSRGRGLTSPEGIMRIQGVDSTGVKITASAMRWLLDSGFVPPPLPPPRPVKTGGATGFASMLHSALFSRSSTPAPAAAPPPPPPVRKDPREMLDSSASLQIFAADVKVAMRSALEKELERSTKKPPPKQTRLQLIFSNADERDSTEAVNPTEAIFSGLKPDLAGERTAKIFIGQATGQTTGIGGHIAARFIPTVERESIDLIDRHVAVWNRELLYVGGYVARMVYEVEMRDVRKAWEGTSTQSTPDPPVLEWLNKRALHLLRFFTFHNSTPSNQISRTMEAAFFSSLGDIALPILSTRGVYASNVVRMPHNDLMSFLAGIPVVNPETIDKADLMVARLRERGMLRDISLDDVVKQLAVNPLDEDQMVACLKWWQSMSRLPEYNNNLRIRLIEAAILTTKDASTGTERVIPLSQVKTYLNPSTIPTDMPLPAHTLPYAITKQLKVSEFEATFGWRELILSEWVTYLTKPPMTGGAGSVEQDITLSPAFSEKVLGTVARPWSGLSNYQQSTIVSALSEVACIPTKLGLKQPGQAYFSNVDLFPDLPIVALSQPNIKGNLRTMLQALGVRSHVELQMVFTRLVGAQKWSCYELMRYLNSVKDTLTDNEIARLKRTAAFPVEDPDMKVKVTESSGEEKLPTKPIRRVTPDALYEPTDEHRNLGLDILDWGAPWRANSEEAKFAFSLGLRRRAHLPTLLANAADGSDERLRQASLTYLIANIQHYNGFSALNYKDVAFVPALASNGQHFLVKPTDAYLNPACTAMGFPVVAPIPDDGAKKLKLLADVPTDRLITALMERPPETVDIAVKQYEYLATRLTDFYKDGTLTRLKTIPFIRATALPSKASSASTSVLVRPGEVFFASKDGSTDSLQEVYKRLFMFVDYGPVANSFLEAVGVRNQPSTAQLADMLTRDPAKFLEMSQSGDVYLAQLRILATSYNTLPAETKRQMTKSAFLLAGKRHLVQQKNSKKPSGTSFRDGYVDEEDMQSVITWDLARAAEICIVDDSNAYNLFGSDIKAAPQEDLLEDFYIRLGSPVLSTLIKEEYKVSGVPSPSDKAQSLRHLVLERLALFLSERNRSSSDITLEHLKKPGNFIVAESSGVTLKRTFRQGQMERNNVQQISAAVIKSKNGVINMYLSRGVELDMYEVAVGLTKALFRKMRPDEPLLLMTILSTPLAALRRRGFNVDRILNQQKVERLAREAEFRERREREEKEAASNGRLTSQQQDAAVQELLELFPNENPKALAALLAEQKSDHLLNATNALLSRHQGGSQPGGGPAPPAYNKPPAYDGQPTSPNGKAVEHRRKLSSAGSTTSLLGNLRSKFRNSSLAGPSGSRSGIESGSEQASLLGESGASGSGGEPSTRSVQARAASSEITPTEDIRQSAIRAVQASRSNEDREIVSQNRQTYVKESADTYCDTSGVKKNLQIAGTVEGTHMPLFMSQAIRDVPTVLATHSAAFRRFAERVILPLGAVFSLNPQCLNMFYDTAGPLIAFNRAGSLFMNARYYIAWHDAAVQAGDMSEAYISWYFTLAHEIAHNLVSQHDSEHEFYMSSICETFLIRLMGMLQPRQGRVE